MNFPNKCPYCNKDISPNCKDKKSYNDCLISIGELRQYAVEYHQCIHCKKPIFVIKQEVSVAQSIKKSEILHCYPIATSEHIPKRIKNLSPTAFETYNQTIAAKESGFVNLVGAGLRIALEWLVWDYLIKIKDKKESELEKLKLYEKINLMSSDFYTEVCTRLIRLFGNDSVHIIKQLNFSIDEVIDVYEKLCFLIDSELQIKEVNNRLPPKP